MYILKVFLGKCDGRRGKGTTDLKIVPQNDQNRYATVMNYGFKDLKCSVCDRYTYNMI